MASTDFRMMGELGPRMNWAANNRNRLAREEGEMGSDLAPATWDHNVNLSMHQFGYVKGSRIA